MPLVVDPGAPGLTFLEMQTEFWARGFDYLSEDAAGITRTQRFLNEAYLELCEEEPWPFCESDEGGVAPLEIANLRQILSVNTDTANLINCDRRTLAERYTDLTLKGTPLYWYLEGNDLHIYPVSATADVTVRCILAPTELSGDSDKTVVPSRYQSLIIDKAVIKGYKDSDDYRDLVPSLQAMYDRDVDRMRFALLHRNYQDSDTILSVGGHEGGYLHSGY